MPNQKEKAVILVIGNFDILHIGHARLFDVPYKVNVITFNNIPRKRNNLGYSCSNKVTNLSHAFTNVEKILPISFEYDKTTAHQFVEFLTNEFKPKQIIVGSNFKFGNDFKDAKYLAEFFDVKVVDILKDYSSTKIKQLINQGKMEKANRMSIYDYYYEGKVVKGKQLGRKLGYKTANIVRSKRMTRIYPGVYHGETILHDPKQNNKPSKYRSAISVRDLSDGRQLIESHIINKDLPDFYGKNIIVIFKNFVNEHQKANNKEELTKIIENNVNKINKLLMN